MMTDHNLIRMDLPCNNKYLNVVGAAVTEFMIRAITDDETHLYNMQLAVQEVCTNIIDHAYPDTTHGRMKLTMQIDDVGKLIITVQDKGVPFASEIEEDTLPPEAQVRGYGLHLIKSLVDELTYTRQDNVNLWTLTKSI